MTFLSARQPIIRRRISLNLGCIGFESLSDCSPSASHRKQQNKVSMCSYSFMTLTSSKLKVCSSDLRRTIMNYLFQQFPVWSELTAREGCVLCRAPDSGYCVCYTDTVYLLFRAAKISFPKSYFQQSSLAPNLQLSGFHISSAKLSVIFR